MKKSNRIDSVLNKSFSFISSLSRYKLKFSPDKVDTMIVQAICMYYLYVSILFISFAILYVALLDDLDKETNNYIMRCKEWYGWHFPELAKIIQDNIAFCKTVQRIGKINLIEINGNRSFHLLIISRISNDCS